MADLATDLGVEAPAITDPPDNGTPAPAAGSVAVASPVPEGGPPAAAEVDTDALATALEQAASTGERPDGLPDQFWDKDKNGVRWDSVVKVIKDQQRAIRTNAPQVPEEYTVELGEVSTQFLTGGDTPADDPLVGMVLDWAKATGQTQENVTALLAGFEGVVKGARDNQPTDEENVAALLGSLEAPYGSARGAKAAVLGLSNFINSAIPETDANGAPNPARQNAVDFAKTPQGFAVLDALRGSMRDRVVPPAPALTNTQTALEEYRALAEEEAAGKLSPAGQRRKQQLNELINSRSDGKQPFAVATASVR